MKKGRFSGEQIIGILKRQEAGQKVSDLARECGVSEATIYGWKSKYGGLEVSEAQRLRRLEEEQREFREFLERLRHAKDKVEFDQFMAERRNRPPETNRQQEPQPQTH